MSRPNRPCRSIFMAVVLTLLPLLAVSCAQKEASATLVPDDYTAWRRTTTLALNYLIPGHESSARTIFMNPTGFRFQNDASTVEFPEGTVIVKEIRPLGAVTADMPAPMLTVMIKKPEDERARGGWLWLVQDTVTKADMVFESDFCYRCHTNANEAHPYADRNPTGAFRDFVFFVPGMDTPANPPQAETEAGQSLEPNAQPSGDGY